MMNKRVKVPIKVRGKAAVSDPEAMEGETVIAEAEPAVVEREPIKMDGASQATQQPSAPEVRKKEESEIEEKEKHLQEWKDRAMRLQAEQENFRKRQRRLAEERVEADRGRLLRNFLQVMDNLERALNADNSDFDNLREGVEVTRRSLDQILKNEGVEPIEAKGEKFDPFWHEAVSTLSHEAIDADPNTVVEVVQQGYRMDGKLLRPARVVVAA
jgi:molecular chaperone GrpE